MKNLLLLHGAIGSEIQFDSLKSELSNDYNVFTFNFPGHGGIEIPPDGFSIDMFAKSVIDFMLYLLIRLVKMVSFSFPY